MKQKCEYTIRIKRDGMPSNCRRVATNTITFYKEPLVYLCEKHHKSASKILRRY